MKKGFEEMGNLASSEVAVVVVAAAAGSQFKQIAESNTTVHYKVEDKLLLLYSSSKNLYIQS